MTDRDRQRRLAIVEAIRCICSAKTEEEHLEAAAELERQLADVMREVVDAHA